MIDHECMALALRLARRGIYTTHPNPNVGCVIVKDGQVCGSGWHRRAGEPHAEIHALREAGGQARGATAYVTLEPCSHHGRTPPCCDALIEAGVARVVVAMQDPNPEVCGHGLQRLRDAGIRVETGLYETQARALNAGFIRRMQGGVPWLRCKLAASLDARTAMASGESQWITGAAARVDVQHLRARSSVILTGAGTVCHDDPSLTVRLPADQLSGVAPVRQPLRVVMDSRLATPASARMLDLPGETLILTVSDDVSRSRALRDAGAEVQVVAALDGRPDVGAVMALLAQREVNEVLLECGPTLAGAFLQAGLDDELIIYVAPHVMGDAARGLFTLPGLTGMDQRIELEWTDTRRVGEDIRLTARYRAER